ncbi:MAG: hypothetical protein OEN01_04205 [Candidatus Krumholzibacteria bacterium]|nr:hypothetical protein [Candidatus Krumholzibacteria bacterium]
MRLVVLVIVLAGSFCVVSAPRCQEDVTQSITIEMTVAADSVTVGERLHLRYRATYPDSLTLLPPGQFDTGSCRLVSSKWQEDSRDGRTVKQADLVVLPLDLETALVPPAPFFFLLPDGDTLVAFSDEVSVPIRQMTHNGGEPKPLKPQWQAPASYRYYFLAGAILLLAAIAFWLWKRRKKPVVSETPRPELPADFVALKALGEIEGMSLLEAGKYKKYYTLVVDTLRHYLERRYGIQAMDRTTEEILLELGGRRVQIDGLEPLLQEADLVKFAKFKPDVARGKSAMQTAKDVVVRTTPRPVVAAARSDG